MSVLPQWTPESLAAALAVHEETIRLHIRQGKLKAYKAAGKWRMYDEDVDAYIRAEPSAPEPAAAPIEAIPQPRSRRRKLY